MSSLVCHLQKYELRAFVQLDTVLQVDEGLLGSLHDGTPEYPRIVY